jgi:hypothetical protein
MNDGSWSVDERERQTGTGENLESALSRGRTIPL